MSQEQSLEIIRPPGSSGLKQGTHFKLHSFLKTINDLILNSTLSIRFLRQLPESACFDFF